MDRDQFWAIIDEVRAGADSDEIADAVTAKLKAFPAEEIVSFDQHMNDLLAESYRWDLWAVAYIVNGGCSDDGFDYARAALIGQGKQRWESAMKDPTSIGEWADEEELYYEDMLYVAAKAYEEKTGKEIPSDQLIYSQPAEPVGEPWEEDALEELYPALCEKYF